MASDKLVSNLVKILAEELYGYNVTFVYDDNWAVSILEGIRDDKVGFHPVSTRHRLSPRHTRAHHIEVCAVLS